MVCMLYHKLSVGHYSLVLIKLKKKKCGSLPLVLIKIKIKTEKKVWVVSIIFGNFC